MPLMFGVMSFFFPAGLTLYIFTNTCLSALHSIYMNKYDKKSLALVAKMKAAAEAAATPVTDAKAGAKPAPGKKSTGKNGTTKAKPVIDVASVEADAGGGDAEDQDDSEQDDSSTSTGSTSSAGARPRPKKKKRRR
jgi:hypothetical protein